MPALAEPARLLPRLYWTEGLLQGSDGKDLERTEKDIRTRRGPLPNPSVAKHLQYLLQISSGLRPLVSPMTSMRARVAWERLQELNPRFPVPASGVGEDGEILYTWNKNNYHLELEIFPDGTAEFFYLDRQSDTVEEDGYEISEQLPDWIVQKLRLFEPDR